MQSVSQPRHDIYRGRYTCGKPEKQYRCLMEYTVALLPDVQRTFYMHALQLAEQYGVRPQKLVLSILLLLNVRRTRTHGVLQYIPLHISGVYGHVGQKVARVVA